MPNNRFSDAQLKIMQKLKAARDRKEGDPTWVDELGEKPDAPVGEGVVVVMVPKRPRNEESDVVSSD